MKLHQKDLLRLRDLAIDAARRAGAIIQDHVGGELAIDCKEAGDTRASQVVTEVDRMAQNAILKRVQGSLEEFDLGLLSEEMEADGSRFEKEHFWCIDPLDGTLPFTENRSGYSVSIALVSKSGDSRVGVVFDPRGGMLYDAVEGVGARRNEEAWTLAEPVGEKGRVLRVFADRSLLGDQRFEAAKGLLNRASVAKGLDGVEVTSQGGAAMNACWVLENAPACYFKFPKKNQGGGSLWDFAASSCIFSEFGGHFGDFAGRTLELNRRESTFLNHRGFCCSTESWIRDCITRGYMR